MTEQRRNAKIALIDLTGKVNTFKYRITKLDIANDRQVRLAFENIGLKVDAFAKNESWWMTCLDTCEVDDVIRAVRDATEAVRESHESHLRGERQRDVLNNLTRALDSVIEAFERVGRYDLWKDKATKSLGNREPTNGRLCFSADRMYARLKSSVDDVKAALESELCNIVALYGDPGVGKSILAKHLALLYQDDCSTQFMDGVFFFSCGPQADSKGLLVQLWQELCYQCHTDLPNSNNEMHLLSMDVDVDAEYKVLIEQLLTNKKVLIILDDVPETTLVEKVVVKGKGIKYVITTQKEGLLRGDDHLEIKITKPDLEDSRRILANHIRGFPGEIPVYLQVEMDKIVEKSRNNPLILANVATKINRDRALEPDEWRSTSNSLINVHDDDIMNASMRLAVDSFPSDSATRKLLIMAAICESQPVPEVVFEIFLNHLGLDGFPSSSEDLEKNNFIDIDSKVGEEGVPRRTWSIHDSRRNFIREYWRDDVVTLVSNLSKLSRSSDEHSVSSDGDLVCCLLVLYVWSNYTYQAVSNLHIPITPGRSSKFDLVKPFVWLLHSDREKPWQQLSHEFAKKVILNYLREGKIHDQGMSTLLTLKEIALTSCHALTTMALLADDPVLTSRNEGTISGMMEILESNIHFVTKTLALYALGRFTRGTKSSKRMGFWNNLVSMIRDKRVGPEIKSMLISFVTMRKKRASISSRAELEEADNLDSIGQRKKTRRLTFPLTHRDRKYFC